MSAFADLHAAGQPLLILPNAWDAGSARLIESLGAKAVATTSAGVAWAQGYPDGDALPVERLLAVVEAIARVVSVPISVDAEGGYGADPAAVAALCRRLADAGAAGVNLEDGGAEPAWLADKISAVKAAVPDLFVNARTDVWLRGLGAPEGRVGEALERGRLYAAAGADGLFTPGVADPGDIAELARSQALPLNVLAWGGLPDAAELARLGARRLTAGSGLSSAAMGLVRDRAAAFLRTGASAPLSDGAMTYPDAQALFA